MVCAAEFSDRKNQMFLVRAMQRLKQEGLPCRLILVGDGERFERTKSFSRSAFGAQGNPFSGVYTGIGALFLSGGCKCICQQD